MTVNAIPPVFSPVQASLVLVFRVRELNKPVKLRVISVEQELEVYKASSEFVVCPDGVCKPLWMKPQLMTLLSFCVS